MSENLGKLWEDMVKEWLISNNICHDRIPDQESGKKNSKNVCDFVAYVFPHIYYIECKESTADLFDMKHNISEYQWIHMLEKDRFRGVRAGYVIWMSKFNKAYWVSPFALNLYYTAGKKSISIDDLYNAGIELTLFKKRTNWHLQTLLDVVEQHI